MPKKSKEKIVEDLENNWRLCPNCEVVISVKKGVCRICGSTYNADTDEWTLKEVKEDDDVKKAKGEKIDDDPLRTLLGFGVESEELDEKKGS